LGGDEWVGRGLSKAGEGIWGYLGVSSSVARCLPLPIVLEVTILVLGRIADVSVGEFLLHHVAVLVGLVHEGESSKLLAELLPLVAQWVAKVFAFLSFTTSKKESIKHVKGQTMVIVTSHLQFLGELVEVLSHLLNILSRVVSWLLGTDGSLQLVKAFDRYALDDLDKVHEDHRKGVRVQRVRAYLL
jgi:hypothetical protein